MLLITAYLRLKYLAMEIHWDNLFHLNVIRYPIFVCYNNDNAQVAVLSYYWFICAGNRDSNLDMLVLIKGENYVIEILLLPTSRV